MTRSLLTLSFLVVAAALVPAQALASFPGKNGPLVVSLAGCYFDRHLASTPWKGGDLTPITPAQEQCEDDEANGPSYAHPEAAPDGSSLIATQENYPGGFVTLGADGSNLSPVSMPDDVTVAGPSGASFSPSGNSFAFDSDVYQRGHETQPIWEVFLNKQEARVIRKADACKRGGSCVVTDEPRWAPNGKLIAVDLKNYRKSGPKSGLWLINAADGKLVRRVAGPGRFDVDWSPDGRFLVYRTYYQQEEIGGGASGGNIYVVSRDGKTTRKLVHRHGIAETQPVWSPDGRWIAWVSMDFTGGDVGFDVFPSLWRVRASGGKPQKIRKLPEPYVEEGEYSAPHLTWLRAG